MPDSRSFDAVPLDWGDAFDRLPLAKPDASAWPTLAHAMRMQQVRRTRMRWFAMAAGVAAVIAVPVVLVPRMQPDSVSTVAVTSNAPLPVVDRSTRVADSASPVSTGIASSIKRDATKPDVAHMVDAPTASSPRVAATGMRTRAPTTSRRASQPAVASTQASITPAPSLVQAPDIPTLAGLQAESAQLETLLALARDERVASGVAVTVGDAQLDRIASIDAALIDDTDPAQRTALWQARVDALREAAAFEGSRRWRGAQGLSMDAALVRVD